ncbi:formyltetrahydrofolate-dependent phosphoribosylglycinamide formyltransferase [Thermosediminibacter litoriperuensis]|uniref:Phosphoribosylglycinamide formyltransferase n=1 Tax=Thermosediminibacter litoriperuensis TaxID=291989 RepID=A0A5S5AXT0_9FIRM|nr:phosphoribosylglycinamide formyltransferase [Thermosediminibacter litoriperuensis]TYP58512.1 formyltetrahydrofolate-dependent phosphoribosylglycinamide formyltransferase [Thermosediminibacter litoriperuensis]
MPALRLGVLVSGNGTNLQAVIDSIESGYLKAAVEVVISSRDGVYALERAKNHGIRTFVVRPEDYGGTEEYEEEMIKLLNGAGVDLVVLAGFIKVLSLHFVRAFSGRIINIHPSLIPSFCGRGFYGTRVHRAALEYGVKVTGATVHFVDEGTDTGPIILQKAVAVEDDDTPESLAARVLRVEHELLPEAIKLYAENRLQVVGRRVLIRKEEF